LRVIRRVSITRQATEEREVTSERYETPKLAVLGEIADLTEGSTSGDPDGADGAGSTEPVPSDVRLKRDVRAL
jgi:hypothetical protein